MHSLTKFLGGHGNSIGGAIVDCGTFDWIKSGRYPTLSAPSPSYHGITLAETFGNFAFAIACARARASRSRSGDLAVQRLPDPDRHRDAAACACSAIATMRLPSRTWLAGQRQDRLGRIMPGCRAINSMRCAKRYCPKGAGAVFTFGLKGGYDAGIALVSNVKLFSHLANIGDTRSLIIHPSSTTHRQLTDEQRVRARRRAGGGAAFGRPRKCRGHHRRSRSGACRGLRRGRSRGGRRRASQK